MFIVDNLYFELHTYSNQIQLITAVNSRLEAVT